MELPHIGDQCSEKACRQLDFLPVKCDGCKKSFCGQHWTYEGHNCSTPRLKDVQVPVCPLCDKPVPSKPGALPDEAVSRHLDRDCRADQKRNPRCSKTKCKVRELIRVDCNQCGLNFCLKHRHPQVWWFKIFCQINSIKFDCKEFMIFTSNQFCHLNIISWNNLTAHASYCTQSIFMEKSTFFRQINVFFEWLFWWNSHATREAKRCYQWFHEVLLFERPKIQMRDLWFREVNKVFHFLNFLHFFTILHDSDWFLQLRTREKFCCYRNRTISTFLK